MLAINSQNIQLTACKMSSALAQEKDKIAKCTEIINCRLFDQLSQTNEKIEYALKGEIK